VPATEAGTNVNILGYGHQSDPGCTLVVAGVDGVVAAEAGA
jgi:hypothetical protein